MGSPKWILLFKDGFKTQALSTIRQQLRTIKKVNQGHWNHSIVTDSGCITMKVTRVEATASLSTGMESELQASSNLWSWLGFVSDRRSWNQSRLPDPRALGHLVLLIKADTEYTRTVGRPERGHVSHAGAGILKRTLCRDPLYRVGTPVQARQPLIIPARLDVRRTGKNPQPRTYDK